MSKELNFKEVSEEVAEWSIEQFGEQDPLNCLAGASEELGELVEARELGDIEEQKDAVADIFIYLCDYAYRSDVEYVPNELSGTPGRIHAAKQIENITSDLGRLHRAQLKNKQEIRETEWRTSKGAKSSALNDAFLHLQAYAKAQDIDFEETVRETLEEVLDREW